MLALSLIVMLAGPVLYFVLTLAGIYRLYPVENYGVMALAGWRGGLHAVQGAGGAMVSAGSPVLC